MDENSLQDIGLTSGENKVYMTLIKLGESKTGPLAKEADVSSSKVYKILDRLENKGLVGHVIKGKVKYFSAMPPERIMDYIDEKEKLFNKQKELAKQLIPELLIAGNLASNKSQAAVYDGWKAVMNLFRSVIDELRSGDRYYVIGAKIPDIVGGAKNADIAVRSFFVNHHMRRSQKKIKLFMLANTGVELNSNTKKNAEIRYLPNYLTSNIQILFYKDTAYIIIWTSHPVAFLIKNEEAVKGFKKYFDTFWKIAKR